MQHLILTGFMGTGKTTIGNLVAAQLQLPFLDSDKQFEKEKGLHVSSYIRRFGIAAFRKWEKQFLRKTLAGTGLVFSTGGGMVLQRENARLMLAKSFVVWLDTPLPLLLKRLPKDGLRPLLPQSLTYKKVKKLFDERKPFYQQCHCRISNAFDSPEKVAIRICQRYKERAQICTPTS